MNIDIEKSKVTLKDIAEKAKVSTTIVCQVINNAPNIRVSDIKRERILKVASELNYVVNRIRKSLVDGKTNIIGIAISGFVTPIFSTSFFLELIQGVGFGLEKNKYDLLLFQPKNGASMDELWRKTVQGGLLEGNFIKDKFIIKLDDNKFPYVLIGRKLVGREVNYVTLDYFHSSYSTVEHLIKLGHKHVGFIGALLLETIMTNMTDRGKGYIHALTENRIKPVNDFIAYSKQITINEGYRIMQKFLKSFKKPTAIFAAHDLLVIGAMNAIKENGLNIYLMILQLLVVTICQKLQWSIQTLTTIKFPLYELGKASVEMLIKIINRKEDKIKRKQTLPTSLIIRRSCGG